MCFTPPGFQVQSDPFAFTVIVFGYFIIVSHLKNMSQNGKVAYISAKSK